MSPISQAHTHQYTQTHPHTKTLMQCGAVHPEAACDIFSIWRHCNIVSNCSCVYVRVCRCVHTQVVIFTFFFVDNNEMRLHWLTGVTTHTHAPSLLLLHFPMRLFVGLTTATVIWCVGSPVSSRQRYCLSFTRLLFISTRASRKQYLQIHNSCTVYCFRIWKQIYVQSSKHPEAATSPSKTERISHDVTSCQICVFL